MNKQAIQLAELWVKGREQEVFDKLRSLSGLEAVAAGALIAIYLESDCEVGSVGDHLAKFNCEIAKVLLPAKEQTELLPGAICEIRFIDLREQEHSWYTGSGVYVRESEDDFETGEAHAIFKLSDGEECAFPHSAIIKT